MASHQITRQQFDELLKVTTDLHDAVRCYLDDWIPRGRPIPGSQLERECREFGDREAVITAYDHGSIINDLVSNQLVALTRTLTHPYLAQASWTALRMLLESAALSAWLLDPACTAEERVKRSFSYRWIGLVEQKKFSDAADSRHSHEAQKKVLDLEAEAKTFNFEVKLDKKQKVEWIAMKSPSSTGLVKAVFNEEPWYRLLSSFVHGHQWAALQLSYQQVDGGTATDARLVQRVEPMYMVGHLAKAVLWFARPIWYRSTLNGFDLARLKSLLEGYANGPIGMTKPPRFWLAGG